MSKLNLPGEKLIEFLCGDFESAWAALAGLPGPLNRCNFLFARQALTLLEIACRVCDAGKSREQLTMLAAALQKRDKRYFTKLPSRCARTREFDLPSPTGHPSDELIAVLFDTVRHGQAHQYQQIPIEFDDDRSFGFDLTGAEHRLWLNKAEQKRPADHLAMRTHEGGHISLKIRTDRLYLDIRDAAREAGIFKHGVEFKRLARKQGEREMYAFSADQLVTALREGGHAV